MSKREYCQSLTSYQRLHTRVVMVGRLGIGGDNPIRLQSMTTTDTMDTEGTIEQSIRMIDAGCELVRITAPSKKEAENLALIRSGLKERGYTTPICADIHFTPNAAEIAARIVEKVRVNPGNYADKKKFENHAYTDESYQKELERIKARFVPLVQICKQHGTALRIGTNHGSLSDRILSRYGDTPRGMVESAMEFLHICREMDFHDIVLSMKASNTHVMVQAYRLLVAEMLEQGMDYPLHLGVTEAGEGEDGRIKSAVGIGALLEDGLGDTVRVSLTEDPEFEIPVAKALVDRYRTRTAEQTAILPCNDLSALPDPFSFSRRQSRKVLNIGSMQVPRVVGDLSACEQIEPSDLRAFGYRYDQAADKWHLADQACDYIYAGSQQFDFDIPGTLGIIQDAANWNKDKERHYPLLSVDDLLNPDIRPGLLNFVSLTIDDISSSLAERLMADSTMVVILQTSNAHGMAEMRRAFALLHELGCTVPVISCRQYDFREEDFQLRAATDLGALLVDGLSDGVWPRDPMVSSERINSTAFGILQAARARISKTEYISCPSCGRTLFDLQQTTALIRQRTGHLKGVKIGIMGCIVNGPGEMADADYGYVGTGKGVVTLYKGQKVVQRNIASAGAMDALVALIKAHGDWVDSSESAG